jgi:hypothetical protein
MLNSKSFSVLIGCYGNYPQYSLRAVDSVLGYDKIYVGMNECCRETKTKLRDYIDKGKISCLIDSKDNINKDPMMRLLVDMIDTKYFIWMDDDSWFISSEWKDIIEEFISKNEFECAGHIYFQHKTPKYKSFLEKRPWYVSATSFLEEPHKDIVWFATGGLFIGRTDFFRTFNFPDKLMVKRSDDLLLGDLISQHGGRLISFSSSIMNIIKISDGDRRGGGEDDNGWKL